MTWLTCVILSSMLICGCLPWYVGLANTQPKHTEQPVESQDATITRLLSEYQAETYKAVELTRSLHGREQAARVAEVFTVGYAMLLSERDHCKNKTEYIELIQKTLEGVHNCIKMISEI